MIGFVTEEIAEASLSLGPILVQMGWPQDRQRYLELREEASHLLEQMELEGVSLPSEQAQYLESAQAISTTVVEYLSMRRGRVKGDVAGLPLFILTSYAYQSVIGLALGAPEKEQEDIDRIRDCLEDLGLDGDLTQVLQREAGRIILQVEGEEEGIRADDVVRAAASFVVHVLEEFGRSWSGFKAIEQAIAALSGDLADFRAESQAMSARLEKLVIEGNAEVTAALAEVRAALVRGGLDTAEAEALTVGDPPHFWERLVRWFGGAPAKNAAEAALWTALDFMPGGFGVKLGINVASAIRGALKASA